MKQSVPVEEISYDKKLQQVFVDETNSPSLKSLVVTQLVELQFASVAVFGNFRLLIFVVGDSNHTFDHENYDVIGIPGVKAPKPIGDESRHGCKIFGWKLQCRQQEFFANNFESLHCFFVGFSTKIDSKS